MANPSPATTEVSPPAKQHLAAQLATVRKIIKAFLACVALLVVFAVGIFLVLTWWGLLIRVFGEVLHSAANSISANGTAA